MTLGPTFNEVLAAARTGAEWAWRALYTDLAPLVLGYFRARRVPEAEDLTGEVFVDVVRGLGGFEGGERDLRAWVLTVAHRRMVDNVRRHSRDRVETRIDAELAGLAATGNAEDEALAHLGTARTREVIARLTPDQQDVLLLRILGDLTLEEIAAALGKRVGAIKALQHRALAALRREISKEGVSL